MVTRDGESGVDKMGEEDQKVQISSYKISHGDVKYSMMIIVNTILHIWE